jgi:rubrerythrin
MVDIKNIQTEVDTGYLYGRIAEHEENPAVANVFLQMSKIEEGHAWAFIKASDPDYKGTLPRPSLRARTLNLIGKFFGYNYVMGVLMDTEKNISRSIINSK